MDLRASRETTTNEPINRKSSMESSKNDWNSSQRIIIFSNKVTLTMSLILFLFFLSLNNDNNNRNRNAK